MYVLVTNIDACSNRHVAQWLEKEEQQGFC